MARSEFDRGVAPDSRALDRMLLVLTPSPGVDLSEQYIVDHNVPDVMTESYGECEADFTQAKAQFYLSLAEQPAAQGITYTVAAGDSGAEGCDDPNWEHVATGPLSVNLLASTPYNTAVGVRSSMSTERPMREPGNSLQRRGPSRFPILRAPVRC